MINLISDVSLFQQLATSPTSEVSNPVVVTIDDYKFIVMQQLQEVGIINTYVIIEPDGKNTAPAILTAALHIAAKNLEALMVVMPSDNYLPDVYAFMEKANLTGCMSSRVLA